MPGSDLTAARILGSTRKVSLCNGQPTPTDPISLNDKDAPYQLALGYSAKHLLHPRRDIGIAPGAAAKQDQAWPRCSGKSK